MPIERLSLRANFSWAFVGNTVFSFSQWGILVVLAKLGSPELVGLFALASAITAPVFMFISLDLTSVQTTDVHDARAFSDYLGLRVVFSIVGMVAVILILWIGGYGKDVVGITALVGLTSVVESISGVSYGLCTKQERLDLVARSLIIRGVIPLMAITVALFLSHSLAVAIFIQLIVWTATLFLYDLPNARRWQAIHPRFDPRVLFSIFWIALPLGLVAGLNSFGAQVPRYAIEHFAGTRDLGIFSAIVSLGMVTSLFTVALSRAALPRLSHWYAREAFDHFNRLLLQLSTIGFAIGLLGVMGAALFGKLFLTIAYTKEYAAHTDVLIVTMVGAGITATFSFVGTALTATRRFSIQPPIHIAKTLVVGVACVLLIPEHGVLGAAWATLFGSIFSGVTFSIILWLTVRKARQNCVCEVQNATTF